MRDFQVLDGGGLKTEKGVNELTKKGRDRFFQDTKSHLNDFLRYAKRPDNRYDVEYAFDSIIEENLMGLLTGEEYHILIDRLISVEDCINLVGKDEHLSQVNGVYSTYVFKFEGLYYKTKTSNTDRLYLEVDELEEDLVSELKIKKYYDFDTNSVGIVE